jgi:putative membrane protein
MVSWLLVLHIFGFTFWISGLLMTSFALMKQIREPLAEGRSGLAALGKLGLRAFADSGAFLAILGGILLVSTNSSYYLRAGWLHIKLVFVLLLIVIHVIIATRSKAFAAGRVKLDLGYIRFLSVLVVLLFVSILIATLPGAVLLSH